MSDAKKPKGFSIMDPQRAYEARSLGGKNAQATGRAHKFTSETAKEAGRKGGQKAHKGGKAHRFTSEEARAAGRLGGLTQGQNARARQDESAAPPPAQAPGGPCACDATDPLPCARRWNHNIGSCGACGHSIACHNRKRAA